ncbi:MAG: site-2 protease family protein [Planctomycetia bacterium]|nr:site-2 protease family protein [Planctomycetia bacterium]
MFMTELWWSGLLASGTESGGWSGVVDFWVPKLAAVLGFGFLIFVHELGHFIAAKACGVQCDRFYLGFGRAIFKRKWGETEYGIGWLPLGGYVLMLGQNDDPRKLKAETERARQKNGTGENGGVDANNEVSGNGNRENGGADGVTETAGTGENGGAGGNGGTDENSSGGEFNPRSYLAKPVWQRAIIISAGVIMNLITAVLLGAWAYAHGVVNTAPQIGALRAGGGAWEAGLDVGDQIDRIGTEKIGNYRDLSIAATFSDSGTDETGREKSVSVDVTRPGVSGPLQFDVVPRTFPGESRPRFGTTSSQTVTLASLPIPEYMPQWIRDLYREFGGRTIESVDVFRTADGREGDAEATVIESRKIVHYGDLARLCARYPDKALRFHFVPTGTTEPANETSSDVARPTVGGNTAVVPAIPLLLPDTKTLVGENVVFCEVGQIERIRRDSVAEKVGLKIGDVITKLDGEPVGDAIQFAETLRQRAFSDRPSVKLTLRRRADFTEKSRTPERTVSGTEVTGDPEVADGGNPGSGNLPGGDTKTGGSGGTTETIELDVTLEPVERYDTPTPWTGDPGVNPGDPFSVPSLGIAYQGVLPEDLEAAQFVLPESVPGMDVTAWSELRTQLEAALPTFRFDESMSWACFVQMCQEGLPPGTKVSFKRKHSSEPVDLISSETFWRADHGIQCTALTTRVRADGIVDALRHGVDETAFGAGLVFRVLGNLNKVRNDIGGPIAIFKGANDTAAAGLTPYLLFLVAISANLAVLNILPIPALDGGHLVFLLWEGVTGRRPNEQVQMVLTMIGILLLLALMMWAIGLDLLRLSGLM